MASNRKTPQRYSPGRLTTEATHKNSRGSCHWRGCVLSRKDGSSFCESHDKAAKYFGSVVLAPLDRSDRHWAQAEGDTFQDKLDRQRAPVRKVRQ